MVAYLITSDTCFSGLDCFTGSANRIGAAAEPGREEKKDVMSCCRDERGGGSPSPGYPHVESNAILAAFHPRIPPGRCPNKICQTVGVKGCSQSQTAAQHSLTRRRQQRRVKRVRQRMPTWRGVKKRTTAQVTAYDALGRGSRKKGGNRKRALQSEEGFASIERSPRNQISSGRMMWWARAVAHRISCPTTAARSAGRQMQCRSPTQCGGG